MDGEVTVVVEGETPASIVEETKDVLEQAVEIAETIDNARQQGESNAKVDAMINDEKFDILVAKVDGLYFAIEQLTGLVNVVIDDLTTISAVQVAEIVETEKPEEVEEIAKTAEEIAAVQEEVKAEEAVTPQIRKQKTRKWI